VAGFAAVESASAETPARRLGAVPREGERVTSLELFFDLVFVLAITQCTTLMGHDPTWRGIGQAMLVLGVLWWSWAGYAWLTSVVDPEEGLVRLAMFAAMAAFLVCAIAAPAAFGHLALAFALAYGVVRLAHIALFLLASRDDPRLRSSVLGLAASTALAIALLIAASGFDGAAQAALWVLAVALDFGGPYFFGTEGWRLVPGHFAERHGLIIIIALGESIVAIGVGARTHLDAGVIAAAALGIALTAALWWSYFDVVAIVSARRLADAPAGRARNALARDSYSYIHLVMVAGIILAALGLRRTLGDVSSDLGAIPAFALAGGVGVYLLGLVAFRYRHIRSVNARRLALGLACIAATPLAAALPAVAVLAALSGALAAVIAYDTHVYGEGRQRVRHGDAFVRREPAGG